MARILSFSLLALAISTPASAYWHGSNGMECCDPCACQQSAAGSVCDHCKMITGVNQRWPSPYVCPDRVAAHAPFDTMISNGWRRQNLMGSHHFSQDSAQLTQAGELKVQWIMTQAPPTYRRMFVERSVDPEVTRRRIETIREYSELIALNQPVPEVTETHIFSEGRPASTVDFVNTQFRQNMRTPMLPEGGLGNDQ